jgi:hypothetical protein
MSPEPPNFLDQRRNQRLGRHSTVPSQHFNQPLLTELLSRAVERFGHAVGIEHQQISREQLPLLQQAIPVLEWPQYCRLGNQPLQTTVASQ